MSISRPWSRMQEPVQARCEHTHAMALHAGANTGDDASDEDAAALEREFEAARAQDAGAVSALAERAAKDRAKGAAIANQKALWDRALELRILLQRCVQVPGTF